MNDYSPTAAAAETVVAITGRTTVKLKYIFIYIHTYIYTYEHTCICA